MRLLQPPLYSDNTVINGQVGYRLRTNNASTYRVQPAGLIRSHRMDQLVFFCESCPRNKYSLGAGYFLYRCVDYTEQLSCVINPLTPTVAILVQLHV